MRMRGRAGVLQRAVTPSPLENRFESYRIHQLCPSSIWRAPSLTDGRCWLESSWAPPFARAALSRAVRKEGSCKSKAGTAKAVTQSVSSRRRVPERSNGAHSKCDGRQRHVGSTPTPPARVIRAAFGSYASQANPVKASA